MWNPHHLLSILFKILWEFWKLNQCDLGGHFQNLKDRLTLCRYVVFGPTMSGGIW